MFCIREKANDIFSKAAPGGSFAEAVAIDCLPYCKVCLELQKTDKGYTTILTNGNIHPSIRLIYVLINGIQAIIEYQNEKLIQFMVRKLEDPDSITEEYALSYSKELVDGCFDIYHSFYDLIEEYYPVFFGESFNHELIHEEIRKNGMNRMMAEGHFGLKHMLHHIHLMLFRSEYNEALEVACSMFLRFSNVKRKSFSRSVHEVFGECVLTIGSALDEGDAEQYAVKRTNEFLASLGIDIKGRDSTNYVIERRMFEMILKKFGVTSDEITEKGLFCLSPSFQENPCLFPRLLVSSDELDLVEFKKVLSQLS